MAKRNSAIAVKSLPNTLIRVFHDKSAKTYEYRIYIDNQQVGRAIYKRSSYIDLILAGVDLPGIFWVLEDIGVKEYARGRGIGTLLLGISKEQITKVEPLDICLVPPKSEYTARIIRWYERNGFEKYPNITALYVCKTQRGK